ncbi:hypothetical protein ES703_98494 [subsurface metagenome]
MDIQDIARNTFTISALLLTATIFLLNYSWKRLKTLISTMPEGKQRVRFNLRSISDPVESDKYAYIGVQFASCILIIISLIGAITAVFIMSAVMVGDSVGLHAADNFEFAVVSMRVAVFCLFMGIMFSGFVYLEDLYALYTGRLSQTTTKLEDMPKPKFVSKAWSYIISSLLPGFFIIIMLVELFVPYNQWVKMTVASVSGIILFICARIGYRVYVRIRTQNVSAKNN